MDASEWFFVIKGLVGLVSTLLYIYHMNEAWGYLAKYASRAQRMRYFVLLSFSVLVTSSSVGQVYTPHYVVRWWHVGSLATTIFLAYTAIESIIDYRKRRKV